MLVGGKIKLPFRLQGIDHIVDDAHQAGLALLAHAAGKKRFDHQFLVLGEQLLDLLLVCVRGQKGRIRKFHQVQQLCAVLESGNLHGMCL